MSFVILTEHLSFYSNMNNLINLCLLLIRYGIKLLFSIAPHFELQSSIYVLLSVLGEKVIIYVNFFLVVLPINSVVILETWFLVENPMLTLPHHLFLCNFKSNFVKHYFLRKELLGIKRPGLGK